MRKVDLALYADVLAARASALAARLERERDGLRQAALEREARRALDPRTIGRLEALGVLPPRDTKAARTGIVELAADLAAVETLQAWVEARLFEAHDGAEEEAESLRRVS